MINFKKKGTVFLTHYRSGGTQLRVLLNALLGNQRDKEENAIEKLSNLYYDSYKNMGEVDFTDDHRFPDKKRHDEIVTDFFYNEDCTYRIIQLNNPIVISYLYDKKHFKYITDNFEVIHLERKNKTNCLLSLALWERFIDTGWYKDRRKWTQENMQKFHDNLIKNPIPYYELYTGIHLDPGELYHDNYIEFQLMIFNNSVHTVRSIATEFNLQTIYYENYENNPKFLYENYFKTQGFEKQDVINVVEGSYQKIPYLTENYIDYYCITTKRIFEKWGWI